MLFSCFDASKGAFFSLILSFLPALTRWGRAGGGAKWWRRWRTFSGVVREIQRIFPELHLLVRSAGDEPLPVRLQRNRPEGRGMRSNGASDRRRRHVEHLQMARFGANERVAVPGDKRTAQAVSAAVRGAQAGAGPRVPDLGPGLGGGQQQRVVRGYGEGADVAPVSGVLQVPAPLRLGLLLGRQAGRGWVGNG